MYTLNMVDARVSLRICRKHTEISSQTEVVYCDSLSRPVDTAIHCLLWILLSIILFSIKYDCHLGVFSTVYCIKSMASSISLHWYFGSLDSALIIFMLEIPTQKY